MDLKDAFNLEDSNSGYEMRHLKYNPEIIKEQINKIENIEELPWPYTYQYIYSKLNRNITGFNQYFIKIGNGLVIVQKRRKPLKDNIIAYYNIDLNDLIKIMDNLHIDVIEYTREYDKRFRKTMTVMEPIYNTEDFLNLSGNKKNSAKRAIRKYEQSKGKDTKIKRMEVEDLQMFFDATNLLDMWKLNKEQRYFERGSNRKMIVMDILTFKTYLYLCYMGELPHETFIAYYKNKPVGVMSYTPVRGNHYITFIKATVISNEYYGLHDWLWYKTVERIQGKMKTFNDGYTLSRDSYEYRKGYDRLIDFKDRYRPKQWLPLYSVEIRKRGGRK